MEDDPRIETPPKAGSESLIITYQPYAHSLAKQIAQHLPNTVEFDDLLAYSNLGLAEAAGKFDPGRGVSFRTFAYYRIRGAIYDGLRKMGWLNRRHYQELLFQSGANLLLESHSYSSQVNSTSLKELRKVTGSLLTCYVLSLTCLKRDLPAEDGLGPDEQLLQEEKYSRVREALRRLPQKNRNILEDYYFKELTLEEIAQKLGLSKSWLSRLHAKSIELLRQVLLSRKVERSEATFGSLGREVNGGRRRKFLA